MELKLDQIVKSIELEIETPDGVVAVAEQIAKELGGAGLGVRSINFSVSFRTDWYHPSTELRGRTTRISALGFLQSDSQESS